MAWSAGRTCRITVSVTPYCLHLLRSFYTVCIIYKSSRGLLVGRLCCMPFPVYRYCSLMELDSPRSEDRYRTQIPKTFIHHSQVHLQTNTHHHFPVLWFTPIASDRQAMQKFSPCARKFLWIMSRLGEGNNSLMVYNWQILVSHSPSTLPIHQSDTAARKHFTTGSKMINKELPRSKFLLAKS
jgi:hypothetical protein